MRNDLEQTVRDNAHVEGVGPCVIGDEWSMEALEAWEDADGWVAVFSSRSGSDYIVVARGSEESDSPKRGGFKLAAPDRGSLVRHIRRVAKAVGEMTLGELVVDGLPPVTL
jgi:hypothetical protein